MSLEQAVLDLTSTIKELTSVLEAGEDSAPVKEEKAAPVKKAPAKKKEAAPTLAEIRDVLRKVNTACGKKEALALLGEYDAKKVGDLEEEDYADFLKDAEEKLEGVDEPEDEEDEDDDNDNDI